MYQEKLKVEIEVNARVWAQFKMMVERHQVECECEDCDFNEFTLLDRAMRMQIINDALLRTLEL